MGVELLLLIILSISIIISIPRINKKLPITLQEITNKKHYITGVFIFVILLSIFNVNYLVYFAILYIMIKVCFVDNKNFQDYQDDNQIDIASENEIVNPMENFGIPTGEDNKNYYQDEICMKLSKSTQDAMNVVSDYNNNHFISYDKK